MIKVIIFLLLGVLFLRCKDKKQEAVSRGGPKFPVINISSVPKDVESWPIKASEFISGFDYIELEMADSAVVDSRYNLLFPVIFSSKYIYVSNQSEELKFNRMIGKFIRKMGKRGRGPEEFIEKRSRCVDPVTGNYIVLSGYNGGIYIYDDNNHFIKRVKLPANTYREQYNFSRIYSVGCNKVMLVPNAMEDEAANPYYDYILMDLEKEEIYYKHLNEKITTLNAGLKEPWKERYYGIDEVVVWNYGGEYNFYLPFEDAIYKLDTLTGKGICRYKVNVGENKSVPYYRASPDAPSLKRYELRINSILETADYLILRCHYTITNSLRSFNTLGELYLAMYNKSSGELVSRKKLKAIENDFGGWQISTFYEIPGESNWWSSITAIAVERTTAGRNRDELTPVGQREYDLYAGRDLEEINQIYRIIHLK